VSDNRRSTTRHDVDLPCAVEDGEAREARVVNLSVGGALIEYPRRPMGHRVALRLHLPAPANHTIEIGAVVRWSADHEIGVQFDGLRPKDVWALNKYFESR
jgi:hypothetical protein